MKHSNWVFSLLLCVASLQIIAQPETQRFKGEGNVSVSLISDDAYGTVLRFDLDGIRTTTVITNQGEAIVPDFNGAARMLVKDAPDLPSFARSIIASGKMEYEIVSSSFIDYPGILVAPSKGNFTRDIDPATVVRNYGSIYKKNIFYPASPVRLGKEYFFRDFHGVPVLFQPVLYNPVTKVLRVYTSIEVRVKPENNAAIYQNAPASSLPAEFDQMYQRQFLNYSSSKYTPLGDVGKMLIICHGNFMTAMQPFVDWKIQRGMPTEIVNVSGIGTTAAAIKSYISNYYNTNGLAFVLLVGDAAQIPTNTVTAGHSDNAYGYLTGADSYPEVIVGRFSAETVAHVVTMVERSVAYEKYPNNAGNWMTANIGIASNQGPGDDNEMDFQHIRNIQSDLIGYNYSSSWEFFDGSQGGLDGAGDPAPSQIATAINQGASVISYCGHGSNTSWGTSGFSNANVQTLTNVNMLPFIFSVACVNGNFVNYTCFAEAWTRSTLSDAPVGAIATLMSTINQSWSPPMDGQDEMIDILTEAYSGNLKRTFGGIAMNGCMHMNDQYGSGGTEMTDTWNIFGDPSIVIRTDNPIVITAQHNPVIPLGSSQFTVNANLDGATAVISLNNQILGTGIITGGTTSLTFLPQINPDTLTLVVWGYNAIPYFALIPLIPASGPYIVYDGNQVNDPAGNANNAADYGEDLSLNISLENVGINQADSVYAILRSTDPYVQITDSTHVWGNIANGMSVNQISAFSIHISDSVPDQHSILFQLLVHDNSAQSWTSYFTITALAPQLSVGQFSWDDTQAGNSNGLPEPGEVVQLRVLAINKGHSAAGLTKGFLQSTLPGVNIYQPIFDLGILNPGDTLPTTFLLSIDTAISPGTMLQLNYKVQSGAYLGFTVIPARLGIVSEDFETGGLTKFNWVTGGTANWTVAAIGTFEGSYSARSGIIGDNQTSILTISMNVTSADSISFWKKVSCEDGSSSGQKWDYLEFFIDNTSMGWWDGEVSWSKESFAVPAGSHTFKWIYAKDYYVAAGSDCAWIDYVTFPMQGASGGWTAYPYLVHQNTSLIPLAGNGNLYPEPGESFYIDLDVLNFGLPDATNVEALLSSADPSVLVTDPAEILGNISGGNSASVTNGFQIAIPASLSDDRTVDLTLTLQCDTSRIWYYTIPLRLYGASVGIGTPVAMEGIKIWPNPAREEVFIYLPVEHDVTGQVMLSDITGRGVQHWSLFEFNVGASAAKLRLPVLPPGTYLLQLTVEGQGYRHLLVIQ